MTLSFVAPNSTAGHTLRTIILPALAGTTALTLTATAAAGNGDPINEGSANVLTLAV